MESAMMQEADTLQNIPCSQLWSIANQATTLGEQGYDVIRLELGRPDFDTPEHIKEAAKKALDEGKVHYVSHFGIQPLREAIADTWEHDTGQHIDPNANILITAGGTEGLYLAYAAFLNHGDEILIGDPGWVTYFHAPLLIGVTIKRFSLIKEGRFCLDLEQIRSRVTPRTRMILLNSPSNPVGGVFTRQEIEALAALAREKGLIVVADEVYHRILFGDAKHYSIAALDDMADSTITINSFSKTYSMTGWRLGYVIASSERIGAMLRVHQQLGATCCSFGQYGAVAALRGSQQCVEDMRAAYERRTDIVLQRLASMTQLSCVPPRGGLYTYIDVSGTGLDGTTFADRFLQEEKVATMPGAAFGETGAPYIRLSIASSETNLTEAMNRIQRFLGTL